MKFEYFAYIKSYTFAAHSSSFEPEVLCLSFHSNTEAVLFACLLLGWATTTGRLLDHKVGNSIKCLSQGHSDALPHHR